MSLHFTFHFKRIGHGLEVFEHTKPWYVNSYLCRYFSYFVSNPSSLTGSTLYMLCCTSAMVSIVRDVHWIYIIHVHCTRGIGLVCVGTVYHNYTHIIPNQGAVMSRTPIISDQYNCLVGLTQIHTDSPNTSDGC